MGFSLLLITVVTTIVNAQSPAARVDCHPEPRAKKDVCESRQCIWQPDKSGTPGTPSCFYPPNTGYVAAQPDTTYPLRLTKSATNSTPCPYGKDISPLVMVPESFDNALAFSIFDPEAPSERHAGGFRMPWHNQKWQRAHRTQSSSALRLETVNVNQAFSYFKVVRASNGRVLFDTSIGGLMYSEQFIQISTYLPSHYVYGLGENPHVSLKHDLSEYKTWPMFARDDPPIYVTEVRMNLYGVHAMYLCVEPDGQANVVAFVNLHAQEVTLGPGPSLTYRAIGAPLEVIVFSGPRPEDAISQYQQAIGLAYLPAYWSLGFQICRWGYNSTKEVQDVVDRQRAAGIPQETQYADIDYMNDYEDFTS